MFRNSLFNDPSQFWEFPCKNLECSFSRTPCPKTVNNTARIRNKRQQGEVSAGFPYRAGLGVPYCNKLPVRYRDEGELFSYRNRTREETKFYTIPYLAIRHLFSCAFVFNVLKVYWLYCPLFIPKVS